MQHHLGHQIRAATHHHSARHSRSRIQIHAISLSTCTFSPSQPRDFTSSSPAPVPTRHHQHQPRKPKLPVRPSRPGPRAHGLTPPSQPSLTSRPAYDRFSNSPAPAPEPAPPIALPAFKSLPSRHHHKAAHTRHKRRKLSHKSSKTKTPSLNWQNPHGRTPFSPFLPPSLNWQNPHGRTPSHHLIICFTRPISAPHKSSKTRAPSCRTPLYPLKKQS